jgi:hypothetical protein
MYYFSPWYSRKIAHLALESNHSFTSMYLRALLSNKHLAYSQFDSKMIRMHRFVIGIFSKQKRIHVQESVSTVNKRLRKQKGLSRMDNPETLATLSTQDTWRRRTKQKNSTHKVKQINNTNPNKNHGWTKVLVKGKQFLYLIKHEPCYS